MALQFCRSRQSAQMRHECCICKRATLVAMFHELMETIMKASELGRMIFKPFATSVILLLVMSTNASAGTITFNDLTDSLTITDRTGRATFSTCPAGKTETCSFAWAAPVDTVSASGGPVGNFNIYEDASLQIVSDQLIWDFGLTGGTASFISDTDGVVLTALPGGRSIVETGKFQNVGGVTWTLKDGTTVTDTIQFVSDVESVPEPGSIALVSIALLGMAAVFRGARR